jgi:hypothetical protein
MSATGTVAGGIRGRSYQAHINERARHEESSEGEKPELRSWGRTYFAPRLLTRLPRGATTQRPDYRQLVRYTSGNRRVPERPPRLGSPQETISSCGIRGGVR